MASSIISSQTDGSSQSQDDRLAELCNILTLEDRPGLIDGDHKDAMLLTKKALSAEAVASALETLMYADEKIHDWERDTVIGNLLWQEAGQKCLAQLLTANPTNAFRSLWKLTGRSMQGSQGMNGLVRTCMSPAIWSDESIRLQALQDVLRLLLAKLVEPDGGRYGIAMKAIAQLMAVHAKELESVLDESNFAIILDHLSIENDAALRSQAILAIAKFIEVANNRAQTMLKDYIKLNIAKHNNDDAVKGFSAAAAMFPILPDQASKLLLSSGFLDDLANIVRKSSSRRLRCAALELLSAACVSKDCRASISSTCSAWLRVVTKEKDTDDVPLAALVLSKISQEGGESMTFTIRTCPPMSCPIGNQPC